MTLAPQELMFNMYLRADSSSVPSQWETALLCNNISHWLGTSLESALYLNGLIISSMIKHILNGVNMKRICAEIETSKKIGGKPFGVGHLTHCGLNRMDAILQIKSVNVFHWMKMFAFWL